MTVATFLAPRYVFRHTFTHPEGVSGSVLCRIVTGGDLAWIASCASVFTLVAIATERYYSIMYPLGDKGKLTDCKLKVGLFQVSSKAVFFFCEIKKQTKEPYQQSMTHSLFSRKIYSVLEGTQRSFGTLTVQIPKEEERQSTVRKTKRWRLYILPQYLANLTQPIGT